MLRNERQARILDILRERGMAKIPELTEAFGVSVITIRRDLDEMANQGLIKKVYGGATLPEQTVPDTTHRIFSSRIERHHRRKRQIGIAAAQLISEGDTIVLDIGTTALAIAKNIRQFKDLTVLTNSLPVLNTLADSPLKVYSLGGRLRGSELALCGSLAFNSLGEFCIDKAFIGAGGITLENGITDFNRDSAELCAAIAQRARQTILVTDSSKFGHDVSAVIGPLTMVDTIITDPGISQEYAEGIRSMGIELIITEA